MFNLLSYSEQNLILTGYTGPNQPLIGSQVAARLQMPFVNIERQFEERSGMSVEEMSERFGESHLKTVETEIMTETVLRRSSVIRISARILLNGNHYQNLKATGPVICLVASLGAILRRQHLALGARYHNPDERALALGQLKREWAVRALDGIYEVDMTYKTEADALETIITTWQEIAVQRG
jgi:shikimate kinase